MYCTASLVICHENLIQVRLAQVYDGETIHRFEVGKNINVLRLIDLRGMG